MISGVISFSLFLVSSLLSSLKRAENLIRSRTELVNFCPNFDRAQLIFFCQARIRRNLISLRFRQNSVGKESVESGSDSIKNNCAIFRAIHNVNRIKSVFGAFFAMLFEFTLNLNTPYCKLTYGTFISHLF